MLEDRISNLSSVSRDTATSTGAAVEHPKSLAVRKRAAAPLPLECVLLSTAQVARALGVSAITVYRYASAGLIPFIKLGDGSDRALRRYRAVDIARFIETRLAPNGAGATE